MILRGYQSSALGRIKSNLLAGVTSQILQMATGGGKTAVASAIAQGAVAKGNRFYFIVDSIELIDQAYARFTADGLPVGVIQGQHELTDYSKPVQVATIQSLKNRWPYITDDLLPSVVMIDECHVIHDAHRKIVNQCKSQGIPVIGLSATPFRKGLGQLFDALVVGATTDLLTREGWLVPAKCYSVHVPNLKGVRMSGGDWQADALAEVMGDSDIVGNVVDHWMKHAFGRKTIVFASNVAHSKQLCAEFEGRGISAAHIDGYMRDPLERETIIDDFRNGGTQVLCNVAVLTKGFDAPETSCVVLARPTKSLMLHIQMVGRGLRLGGEPDCLILDHAGNLIRNGLPTDKLPEELDDGKIDRNLDRREREIVEKPCASCGFLSHSHKCPACGFTPERQSDVVQGAGELSELAESPNIAAKRNRTETRAQKADFYAGLLGYCYEKGFRTGWAKHKYKDRYGVWPNAHRNVTGKTPSAEVLGWVRHCQIRDAHKRAAA